MSVDLCQFIEYLHGCRLIGFLMQKVVELKSVYLPANELVQLIYVLWIRDQRSIILIFLSHFQVFDVERRLIAKVYQPVNFFLQLIKRRVHSHLNIGFELLKLTGLFTFHLLLFIK